MEWFLNGFLFDWVGIAAGTVMFAMATRTAVTRAAGFAVVSARYSARLDTLARLAILAAILLVPVLLFLYFWWVPPDGIVLPEAG
jgi:preprotein translocase subunit SecF